MLSINPSPLMLCRNKTHIAILPVYAHIKLM